MNEDDGESVRGYPDGVPLSQQPQFVRDFPTDIPADELVARREFIKFMTLTSGAFVTGQCWIGLAGQPQSGPFPRQRIASLAELRSQRVMEFRYPTKDDPCLLIALGADSIVAYGQKCTHLSCAVIPDLNRGELLCPCHHGHFEIAAGRPTAGPARRPLPLIHIEIQGDAVFAIGVELRTV
jgi:nitrite reductase/ring-hydroxylating ferredoxin subunit